MFRDGVGSFKTEQVNFILNDGGVGDQIARMPVFIYMSKEFPHVIQNVWTPEYAVPLYRHCFYPYKNILVRPYSKGEERYNTAYSTKQSSSKEHTNMGTHLTDHGFHVLADKQVDKSHKNYPSLELSQVNISQFKLPDDYVVITTGYTASVREMLANTVNAIADYVISKGYVPLFLGSKNTHVGMIKNIIGNFSGDIEFSKGIDLVGKTSLLQAAKIIALSQGIVGLDNGLLHLAGCTDVPIVAGYTTVAPIHRMPYRYNELGWNCYPVVPSSELKCRFCQSNWEFVYDHDFRNCYYKQKGYDTIIQCVKQLTADKYIEKLEQFL